MTGRNIVVAVVSSVQGRVHSTESLASETSLATDIAPRSFVRQDSSPQSRSALNWTIDNLVRKGDKVRLVSVIDAKSTATYSPPSGVPIELDVEPDQKLLSNCNSMLSEYQQIAKRKAGDVKASTVVSRSLGTSSDHGREICEFAAENGADILVVGSRGHGSFKRSIMGMFGLGSVSSFVVQHSPVENVMVHRGAR